MPNPTLASYCGPIFSQYIFGVYFSKLNVPAPWRVEEPLY